MLTYICRTINESKHIEEITITCNLEEEIETIIRAKNLQLLSYKRSYNILKAREGYNINSSELLLFTQTINMLIAANLSINDVMKIASETLKQKKLQELSRTLSKRLEKGERFSSVLDNLIPSLPPLYLGLIRVGEKTGNLKMILKQLTAYLERDKEFKSKLKSAMVYPLFIMILTMIFSITFIVVILPQFNTMFASLGGGLGTILKERGQILTRIIITGLVLLVTITILLKSGSTSVDKFLLKLPFIGHIILENSSFTLVFTMAVLSKSALSIEESLNYVYNVIGNKFLKGEVTTIREDILRGEPLSKGFSNSCFPSRISSFIKVGEKTGDIGAILTDLSNYYSAESDKRVEIFMSIIDPVFTLIIGALLFTLILLFILPVLTKMGDLL